MRNLIFAALAILICLATPAADIRIGLLHGAAIESLVFSAVEGEYMLSGDGKRVAVIRKGAIFHIERTGKGLSVHDTTQSYGIFSTLEFNGVSTVNVFQVKSVFPALPPKESDGSLTVTGSNDVLKLINLLDMEQYIAGTVEAEGGSGALPEYYKAQAVIIRTFAIKNARRHAHEGFNLCDGVHCQAYNGKSRMNRQIYEALVLTEGIMLAGKTGEPVITAYHASCGGITGSASVEWNKDLPHLAPVKDPFCNKSVHKNWSKTLTLVKWDEYLRNKNYTGEKAGLFTMAESGRQKYLDPEDHKLLLKDIREQLQLKSSWFHVEAQNGSVVILGHGYGHGLGMCQEGAMEMARVGYTYVDILMFYYKGLMLKQQHPAKI